MQTYRNARPPLKAREPTNTELLIKIEMLEKMIVDLHNNIEAIHEVLKTKKPDKNDSLCN